VPKNPFSITANPLCLARTGQVLSAFSKIEYAIETSQGLSVICGDYGLGKSVLCRALYTEYVSRDDVKATIIPTPDFPTIFSMLQWICDEFELPRKKGKQSQQTVLEDYLVANHEAGKKTLLFIDEAHLLEGKKRPLTGKAFEFIRSLLNYSTEEEFLLSIVLAGQLPLKTSLESEDNAALFSRIATIHYLSSMTLEESRELIQSRCDYYKINLPFTPDQIEIMFRISKGNPRALLKMTGFAYKLHLKGITNLNRDELRQVASEVAVKLDDDETEIANGAAA